MSITITVERPSGTDQYGDPLPGTPTTHTIDGCALALVNAGPIELADRGREGTLTRPVLYVPAGADLLHTDRIVISEGANAGRYEIDGRPFEWENPFTGWTPGLEVPLRRAEG